MDRVIVLARVCGLGLLGFLFPRILEGMGIPLEEWAEAFGSYLASVGIALPVDTILIIFAIACALLAITLELWWRPAGRIIERFRGKFLSPKIMPLNEAATMLYGNLRTCNKDHFRVVHSQSFDDQPDGIATYFAIYISQNADVFGKRPPSIVVEKVDPKEWNRGSFRDGGNSFYHYHKDKPEYVELMIESGELHRLQKLLESEPPDIDY